MVNADFAYLLHGGVNRYANSAQICIIFALSKFEANLFLRPVSRNVGNSNC